jgi:hypothetical protein
MRRSGQMGSGTVRLVAAVAIGVLVAAALSVTSLLVIRFGGDASSTQAGPYSLTPSNTSVGLSFPDCSLVHVKWQVGFGGEANFSVWPPAIEGPSDCRDVQESNATCPQNGCPAFDPGPVCYETGWNGECYFTSDQVGYTFTLYSQDPGESQSTVIFYTTV